MWERIWLIPVIKDYTIGNIEELISLHTMFNKIICCTRQNRHDPVGMLTKRVFSYLHGHHERMFRAHSVHLDRSKRPHIVNFMNKYCFWGIFFYLLSRERIERISRRRDDYIRLKLKRNIFSFRLEFCAKLYHCYSTSQIVLVIGSRLYPLKFSALNRLDFKIFLNGGILFPEM